MADFRDPDVVVRDFLALSKLCLTLGGLYIWEFFITLDYEWHVIKGHRPYRWTIWLYSLTRLSTLMAVIINTVTLDVTARTNCQVWVTLGYTFGYIIFAFSSLLIILRIIAIWNKNKVAIGLTAIAWVVNVSFLVYGITRIRSSWDPDSSCSNPNVVTNKPTLISMLVTDLVLLVTMLIGLLCLRCHGAGRFALGRLLWKQGIIWLFAATAAELPPVVFISLNLNVAFNLMFLMPSLITMSIAATWMYRSLADFLNTDIVDSDNAPRIGPAVPDSKPNFTPPKPVEVAVHTSHEEYPSESSSMDRNVFYIGRDHPPQLQQDKPHSLCLDTKAE